MSRFLWFTVYVGWCVLWSKLATFVKHTSTSTRSPDL